MSNQLGVYLTRSGETVKLRLIQKEDAELLVELFHRLSLETKRRRFHLYTEKLPQEQIWQEAIRLCDLDPRCHVAIVATMVEADGQEHVLGVARFARGHVEDTEAEVAIVVRDDFQRQGLGRCLLNMVAEQARGLGLTHLTGWVTVENVPLMKLIKKMELVIETEVSHGYRKIRAAI